MSTEHRDVETYYVGAAGWTVLCACGEGFRADTQQRALRRQMIHRTKEQHGIGPR